MPPFRKTFVTGALVTIMFLILLQISFRRILNSQEVALLNNVVETTDEVKVINKEESNEEKRSNLKYILQWTSPNHSPFVYMGKGQEVFINNKCSYTNCFVTANRGLLGDYTKFDVIAFSGSDVIRMSKSSLPERRSPHQKFAFGTIESAYNYPACTKLFNGFFNWTWTYRLDSEVAWGYITVRDAEKKVVGPKVDMHWMKTEDMESVSQELKERLKTKTKAAAWFVSNCHSLNDREKFVKDLQAELERYNLTVDIYGLCGSLKCGRDKDKECNEMIERDYYFYLSFENSFSEDYVTEKLVRALQYNLVPVVYGGANYTRFMPDGIYLNARELGVEKLAAKMYELIKNPAQYADYFRWKKHYSYYRKVESRETDTYCRMCELLNNDDEVRKTTIYENFAEWWNPPGRCELGSYMSP